MKVDFNNLRLQIAFALDDVIKTLNNGKLPEKEYVLLDNNKNKSGDVLVDSDDLEKDINNLRHLVFSLICCYEEDNDDYICLCDKLEENGGLAHFNYE